VPVVTVISTFNAAVIHLIDAASPKEHLRRHALRHLRLCVVALSTMGLAWSWSERALRTFRLLANEWLIPHAVPTDLKQSGALEDPNLSQTDSRDTGEARQKRFWDNVEQQQQPEITVPALVPQYGDWTAPASWLLEQQQHEEAEAQPFPEMGSDPDIQGTPAESSSLPSFNEIDWLFDVDLSVASFNNITSEFDSLGQLDSCVPTTPQQAWSFDNLISATESQPSDQIWLFSMDD